MHDACFINAHATSIKKQLLGEPPEAAKKMQAQRKAGTEPTEEDQAVLKRVARYLVGRSREVVSYPWRELGEDLTA